MAIRVQFRTWRWLLEKFPTAVPFDTGPYEAALDAIDVSLRGTWEANGRPTFPFSPSGWGDPVIRDNVVVGVDRRPIVPIRSDDAAQVLVALIARDCLRRANMLASSRQAPEPGAVGSIMDAATTRLLKRRLRLTPQQLIDLAKVAILPDGWDLDLLQIIGLIEKNHIVGPWPEMRQVLLQLADRIESSAIKDAAMQKQLKRKVSTKRLDGTRERVLNLAKQVSTAATSRKNSRET